uniref:Uncharacterized protein n=1 Tax=Oryza glumipatula TaxID=40148 RepID=A0A0D9YBW1_9ORYZ
MPWTAMHEARSDTWPCLAGVYVRRKPAWVAWVLTVAVVTDDGITGESLARPWAGMTTTPLGVVPLLGGVVLALTSPSIKNLSRTMVAIGGLLQCLQSPTSLAVESELLHCKGATKLGNDDTVLQSLYRIVDASCVQEMVLW